ncbi:MAG: hypothetical protein AB7U73_01240 [Pirellulales bacterium]
MANEFVTKQYADLTINHYVWSGAQIYNGSAFVDPDPDDWSTYAIPATEVPLTGGQSRYKADFPTSITTAGVYRIETSIQAGEAPDQNDPDYGPPVALAWDGAREVVGALNVGGVRFGSGGGNQVA